MTNIDVNKLTLDQYRKLKWFKLPDDIEKIITINTYYRIIKWTNKYWPQERSIEKLRKWFNLNKKTFDILLENQLKQK